MTVLLAFAAGTIAGITLVLFVIFVGFRKPDPNGHRHHIWDNWELFEIPIVNDRTGKIIYHHSAQKRKCLSCNYEQREAFNTL